MSQFDVYSTSVQNIISWIKSGEVAIPEIQRPFVWDSTKVRDLLDSLYKGFPVGYIIVWKNPDVRLKDGTISIGKKILIDGQQRPSRTYLSGACGQVHCGRPPLLLHKHGFSQYSHLCPQRTPVFSY